MALVVPRVALPSWSQWMNLAFNDGVTGLKCHLFDAFYDPDDSTVLADLLAVEASFAGYAPQAFIGWGDVGFSIDGHLVVASDPVTFTLTAGSADIYGYFLTDLADSVLFLAELAASGPTTINTGSPNYTTHPRFIWASEN